MRDLTNTKELYDLIGSRILWLILHVMVGTPQGKIINFCYEFLYFSVWNELHLCFIRYTQVEMRLIFPKISNIVLTRLKY